jgi:hypothetical protein
MDRLRVALFLLGGASLAGCGVLLDLDHDYVLTSATSGGAGGDATSSGSSAGGAGASGGASGSGGAGGSGAPCGPGDVLSCYPGPPGTEGFGVCAPGSQVCGPLGVLGPCEGAVVPSAEVCGSGADESCDGEPACSGLHRFSKIFGSEEEQIGESAATDSAGNVFMAGSFTGRINLGGTLFDSAGGADAFLVKLDPTGKLLWGKRFGATKDERAEAVDSAGNVVVAGVFESSINLGGAALNSTGGSDVFVAKLSPDGAHLWSKSAGDGLDQWIHGVAVDGADNILLTGAFESGIGFGGSVVQSAGGLDIFVAKLGPDGAHVWTRGFGGPDDQRGASVAADSAGNVVVLGSLRGAADLGGGSIASVGGDDVALVKLTAAGAHVFSKGFGDAADQVGEGVAIDGQNGIVLTGTFSSVINFGGDPLVSLGKEDVFVARLSPSGAHQQSARFGDADSQLAAGVAIDAGNNVILTGSFAGSIDLGGGPHMSSGALGALDIFAAKLATNGAYVWSKAFGAGGDQAARAVAVDDSNALWLTGFYKGRVAFGGASLPPAGGRDFFAAKLSGLGDHVFSASVGDAHDQVGAGVAADPAGNIALTGYFSNSVDLGGGRIPSGGAGDLFVAMYSPALELLWAKAFGDASGQVGDGVAFDPQGNLVLAAYGGGALDLGGGNLPGGTGYDVLVAKFSPLGDHLFSKRFPGAGHQRVYGVAVDGDGNIVIVGSNEGTVSFGGETFVASGIDAFVAKLDPAGNHVFSKQFGGAADQTAANVAVGAAGDIAVSGYFAGQIDLGGAFMSAGDDDIFVMKLSAEGNILWGKTFGAAAKDQGHGVAVDSAGDVTLVGYASASLNFGSGPLSHAGGVDLFIAKWFANGELAWSRAFGNALNQVAFGVADDGAGNLVVTGYTSGGVDFGGGLVGAGGSVDAFVLKLDASDGSFIWSRAAGDALSQQGFAVTADAAGNVVMTGLAAGSADFGGGPLTSSGAYDVLLVKLAP